LITQDQKAVARFWIKVDRRSASECWPWLGQLNAAGYGYMKRWHQGNQLVLRAHRIAVLLDGRDIPSGYQVCHHCDNPSCVNPAHLFIGTILDNHNDKMRKGRQASRRSGTHRNRKLSLSDIEIIKREVANGKSRAAIARERGVAPQSVDSALKPVMASVRLYAQRYDKIGRLTVISVVRTEWLIVRRPRGRPFVMSTLDWPELRTAPARIDDDKVPIVTERGTLARRGASPRPTALSRPRC
jgi:hypothetical protein